MVQLLKPIRCHGQLLCQRLENNFVYLKGDNMSKMAADDDTGMCLTARLMVLFVAIFIAGIFWGCKTVPQQVPAQDEQKEESVTEPVSVPPELTEVHPLALLGSDFSIYAFIPAGNHRDLTAALLMEEINNLSESDAKLIAKRINELYFGLGTVSDRSRLEVAASGNIPPIGIKTTFTKKSGWKQTGYTAASNERALKLHYPHEFTYYSHDESVYDVCFFSQQIFGIAQNIVPVMEKYALRPVPEDTAYNRWISQETDDILFYITRPGQYLRSLIGSAITTDADCVYGSLVKMQGDVYSMTMNIHVTHEKAVNSLKSTLALSFGLMGASLSQPDKETVRVSGIEVTQKQIVDVVTRDPVTGKHYRVKDDGIIEEAR